jgi:hypothetical protein
VVAFSVVRLNTRETNFVKKTIICCSDETVLSQLFQDEFRQHNYSTILLIFSNHTDKSVVLNWLNYLCVIGVFFEGRIVIRFEQEIFGSS